MHLSKEIQGRLTKMGSSIKLASTIDGTFPNKYSFYSNTGRSFRAKFTYTEKEVSIVLFEKTGKQNYENCYARGTFTNLDKLAKVIALWIEKQKNVSEIKNEYDELELYTDFEIINPNKDINEAWTKVKNMFFNDTDYWKQAEWNQRYLEMLTEAKGHKAFEKYYPFTSHYWLRFSTDKDLINSWPLHIYVIPTMYSVEIPKTIGKFYVSYNSIPLGGQFFETAKEGLDFLEELLKQSPPVI